MTNASEQSANDELFAAIELDDVAHLRAALDAGADPNCVTDRGETPLYVAASADQVECIKVLAEAGANLNSRHVHLTAAGTKQILGPALTRAVNKLCLKTVDLLLDLGADPRVTDMSGNTAGHAVATVLDRVQEARGLALLERVLSTELDVNQLNSTLHNMLFIAVQRKAAASAIQLLLDHGADPNIMNFQGMRPIHHLFDEVQIPSLELLLKAGVDVNSPGSSGRTALFYFRDAAVGRALIAHGADPRQRCNMGQNALTYRMDITSFKTDLRDSFTLLLESGVRVDEPDYSGVSAQSILSESSEPRAKELLGIASAYRARQAMQSVFKAGNAMRRPS